MAVFTELTPQDAAAALSEFSLGAMTSLTPIAGGIENTNYFLDTERGRWVLTVFERLTPEQLPFYLEFTEHLKAHGCRVAAPVRTRSGRLFSFIKGKPFAIANRLEGAGVEIMSEAECRSMGEVLAQMHIAALDFKLFQPNLRGLDWIEAAARDVRPHLPPALFALLADEIAHQKQVAASDAYRSLTVTACHCDLFRNNTLISGHGTQAARVAGVFDFYFAGCTPWLFDLAVTVNDWCIDPETGVLDDDKTLELLTSYHAVRPLTHIEKTLWRDMLRAGALRFWTSRLYDFYLPREAALLTPHDPTQFERILKDRKICPLVWPE